MTKPKKSLHPPLLPSWGTMIPQSPPQGYGDISFDPRRELSPETPTPNTDLDIEAIALLDEIFPSGRKS